MLDIYPQYFPQPPICLSCHISIASQDLAAALYLFPQQPFNLGAADLAAAPVPATDMRQPTSTATSSPLPPLSPSVDEVAQALGIARESPEGAQEPTVCKILEVAISRIWAKVEAKPDAYVMTRDEFAVFNYFQNRFDGNEVARKARARFWDKN
ncbi:hypothetical protein B0T17DRAFT_619482 [Bombardia bombarda]|uniref:Uncharacterized protein n=1 Tax=Bombardia bombarda TaxID=252184 RepID=A0AA39WIA4_9PEZI|nr:hypothetical protein B0T17DRAFT_619482 [Bombardia bombarda]